MVLGVPILKHIRVCFQFIEVYYCFKSSIVIIIDCLCGGIFELITKKVAIANRKDSDQSVNLCSLARTFISCLYIPGVLYLMFSNI